MISIKKIRLSLLIVSVSAFCVHSTSCMAKKHVKPTHQKALIWDLGSTLLRPSKGSIASSLGIWDAFCFFAYHGRRCSHLVKDSLFDILSDGPCDTKDISCDPSGKALPALMCKWFEGNITSTEVRMKAHEKINNSKDFLDNRHKRITERTIDWMFNPAIFAQSMKPVKGAQQVLDACRSVKDTNGKQLHSLYILSNWDAESFDILYNKIENRCLFKYFKPENIFISAREHDIKPRPSFFQRVIEKSGLKASDCIFLDDQDENIKAAEELGMTAIKVNYKNYTDVYRKLKALHVF